MTRFGITRGTVSTATCKLMRKLKVTGLAGLTRLAIRRGYIQP
jgi:DNA-binding NarL/FixJ family response regulator